MAIEDMKGTVSKGKPTLTGMMNQKPNIPDMSKMKMPVAKQEPAPKEVVQQSVEEPKKESLLEKVQNLTNEDKAVLSTVLSPSVSNVLSKIAPDLQPLLTQFTKDEENVVLPVSIVKNFASRKYPGTEQESVQSFVSDLAGQMEQTQPVPPDTQMAEEPDNTLLPEVAEVDSGELA
jgi:hypothetical protein